VQASREPDDPSGNVRYDLGGWISGPSLDPPLPRVAPRIVPPGSTPLREFAHAIAIAMALALPRPATERDELSYLRITRDRARLVLLACRKIMADGEIEDDQADVMAVVTSVRDQVTQLPDDAYDDASEPTL
jgi:hypothetical protein